MYNALMGAEVIPKLTYEEFRQLPDDGKRYELIHGEVHLTPAPNTRHQWVSHNLDNSLSNHVHKERLGEVWVAPLDVRLSEDIAVQPDLIFISNARAEIIHEDYIAGAPDLVVEVLSPSTARHDRATKLRIYAEAAVPNVWYLDPVVKTVELLKLQGKKYIVDSVLAGDQVLKSELFPGWELPLERLFDFHDRF
ncbi:MAG: Uma2 family endonuclease [Terriglobia bacterium]